MTTEQSIRILSAIRLGVGATAWLAPSSGGRLFGLDAPGPREQTPYFARLFGVRDIAMAAGTSQSTGAAQRQWLTLGVACDAADVAAAILGRRNGYLPPAATVLVGGTALAATALGVNALRGAPA